MFKFQECGNLKSKSLCLEASFQIKFGIIIKVRMLTFSRNNLQLMSKWMLINFQPIYILQHMFGQKEPYYHFILFHGFWSIFSTVIWQVVYKYKRKTEFIWAKVCLKMIRMNFWRYLMEKVIWFFLPGCLIPFARGFLKIEKKRGSGNFKFWGVWNVQSLENHTSIECLWNPLYNDI